MHPLLTFTTGILAGIVGIKLLNKASPPAAAQLGTIGGKARQGLAQAQSGLRDATVSGLEAIEKSSANLRAKLAPTTPTADAPAPAPTAPTKTVKAKTPRKAKAKPATDASGGTTP